MITVSELFESLSLTELAQSPIGNCGDGVIPEEHHKKLIVLVNEGLLRLFSKFNVKTSTVMIEQLENLTRYKLDSKYAVSSNEPASYKYIIDYGEKKFEDDVIKIISAFTSDGVNHPLNDRFDRNSFFTPQPTILQIPNPEIGKSVSVQYQAKHVKIKNSGEDYLNQMIDIPFIFEDALKFYIASKVYLGMLGDQNNVEGQKYLMLFNDLCNEIKENDLASQTTSGNQNTKLEQRGFI